MAQQIAMMTAFENQNKNKASGENKPSVVICEHVTPQGIKLQVRHGDITEEEVGAIVNAANKFLDHASGVAGAISKKGGPIIQAESDMYIAKHGHLEEGAVVSLPAGNLKCRYVFHAVGPMWKDGKQGEDIFLTMAVRACLDQASALGLESISMPAISTGIFKFPKPVCAELMFSTTLSFISQVTNSSLKEIRFTNFDDDTVNIFKNQFQKLFEDKK